MIAISYKHSKKGGINRFLKKITAILRISNLQQSLILRVRTANITPNMRSGGGKIDGRESVDSFGGDKFKDWKSDRKSFDFSRTVKKDIPIFSNS
jgi:hypothetical protein